jgi:hypothetical protein
MRERDHLLQGRASSHSGVLDDRSQAARTNYLAPIAQETARQGLADEMTP